MAALLRARNAVTGGSGKTSSKSSTVPWARIEPSQRVLAEVAVAAYRDVIDLEIREGLVREHDVLNRANSSRFFVIMVTSVWFDGVYDIVT